MKRRNILRCNGPWFYFPKAYFVQIPNIFVKLTLSKLMKIKGISVEKLFSIIHDILFKIQSFLNLKSRSTSCPSHALKYINMILKEGEGNVLSQHWIVARYFAIRESPLKCHNIEFLSELTLFSKSANVVPREFA